MFRFIALLAIIPAILATEGLLKCRDGTAQPRNVNISDCLTAPCTIALGSTAQMTVEFVAPRAIKEFTPKVQAGVLGLWIDYALPADVSVGCDFVNGTRCPLDEGEDVIYDFLFALDDSYPTISVDVELSLNDSEGKFGCVQIPIKVVKAN